MTNLLQIQPKVVELCNELDPAQPQLVYLYHLIHPDICSHHLVFQILKTEQSKCVAQ